MRHVGAPTTASLVWATPTIAGTSLARWWVRLDKENCCWTAGYLGFVVLVVRAVTSLAWRRRHPGGCDGLTPDSSIHVSAALSHHTSMYLLPPSVRQRAVACVSPDMHHHCALKPTSARRATHYRQWTLVRAWCRFRSRPPARPRSRVYFWNRRRQPQAAGETPPLLVPSRA